MTKRLFLAVLLISALLLSNFFVEPTMGKTSLFCKTRCKVRCSKAGLKDRCLKYCKICCSKCKCVPPGTYGNSPRCACYARLKNSKGNPKCP